MNNLEEFVKTKYEPPENMKKFTNKIFRLYSYRKNFFCSCLGIGVGLGLYFFGLAKSDNPDLVGIKYAGFGGAVLSAVACYSYKKKQKKLEIEIEEDMDTLKKGGMIDD